MFVSSVVQLFLLLKASSRGGVGIIASFYYGLVKLIFFGQFVLVVYGFYWRMNKFGRVCCGYFLVATDKSDGYLIHLVKLCKNLFVIWLGMFSVYLFACFLLIRFENPVRENK